MKEILLVITMLVSAGKIGFGQNALLDTEKHASCELFAQKSGYDWQQRLSQIDSLENQEVTVFELKGRDNQIKMSYSGKVKNYLKNRKKTPGKGDATLIGVMVEQDGQKRVHFPLTNDKRCRIYLKSCLAQGDQ